MAAVEGRRKTRGKKRTREGDEAKAKMDVALVKCIRKLGYDFLKKEQEKAIVSFMEGNDVFVCLPTGFGKSLCYFCLPSLFDIIRNKVDHSVAIVVSPLVTLMSDQMEILRSKGVNVIAVYGNNKADDSESQKVVIEGNHQIIFTNPETLFDKEWKDLWRSPSLTERMVAFVVDEAHCVKKW